MKKAYTFDPSRKLPFCSAVRAGDFIFLSGIAATRDDAGRELKTVGEQTRQIMENMKKTLGKLDANLDDVVKMTMFLCDNKYFKEMNEAYLSFFQDYLPARSTAITGLAIDAMLIEVECVVYKPLK
jgi:enamine deaminase RidA (YjgF/YER057c/UK114 family)